MDEIANAPETCPQCGALMGDKTAHLDWHERTLDVRLRKVSGQVSEQVQELAEKARRLGDRSN
jgi:hypothetical protein